ncbi:MAG: C39 family peptidase [Limisphaerales bacterium]
MHRAVILLVAASLLPVASLAADAARTAPGAGRPARSARTPPPTAPVGPYLATLLWTNLPPVRMDGADTVLQLGPFTTAIAWDEVVLSWNVQPAAGAALRAEVRAVYSDHATRWYPLGTWSLDDTARRASVKLPADDHAEVRTDILALAIPAHTGEVRFTLLGELARHPERLRRVAVSLSAEPESGGRAPLKEAWGRTNDVPQRSQVSYPEGRAWCSPTSISMLLAWWARELGRPALDLDVPVVARGVHDPAWPGTGNWSFNAALAGAQPGLAAFVTRLRDLRDLEMLTAAGLPPAVSVSYGILKGGAREDDDGHLVVIAGFTPGGDPVINDPWAKLAEGQPVRRVYRRADLEKAWVESRRTAYLVLPEARLPEVAKLIGAELKQP